MTYKPLAYGSREWRELKTTVRTTQKRTIIKGVPAVLEIKSAARPGLWTRDSAVVYTILINAKPISLLGTRSGMLSQVTEEIAWGVTREEAVTKAIEVLTNRGVITAVK